MEPLFLREFDVGYKSWTEVKNLRVEEKRLFLSALFRSAPHHPGLFLRAKTELFVKARHAGAEPEEFDFLETRVG